MTMKRQSAWRAAKARPAGDDPALIKSGRPPFQGLGLPTTPCRWKYFPCVIERLGLGPDAFDDAEPLLGIGIALVMVAELDAEHLEFADVPARDDIESEASTADMVGADHGLCGEYRIDQRNVHGGEGDDVACCRKKPRRPGQGLETGALSVGDAAITLPARDRQQKFDAGLVG